MEQRAHPGDDLRADEKRASADECVYFYGHARGRHRCFSNFYPSEFSMTHEWLSPPRRFRYTWGEQAIMHAKALLMGDENAAISIMQARSPKECKALGRRVKPFDLARWKKFVAQIAFHVEACKFEQNPDLAAELEATGDLLIAEAAANDRNWGIGLSEKDAALGTPWRGENLLGETLMRVRARLRGA
jgi:ribA/ribD-fused uncharacterized protein